MTLPVGQVIDNRYRIARLLGQGGMGAVYRAWDTRLSRPVALKEMVPQFGLDAEMLAALRQQFRQEAQVLGTLDHPNLVRVTDYFSWNNNEYLVMDFVDGESLAERIAQEGAQSEGQVVEWAGQLLDALAYCHGQGVLHRDIKPQNIIITPEGRAELVDFGLVKLWDPNDPQTRTVMRGAGTPEYAPPEQYDMGMGHTDPRSDIYGLGATLYHALTGEAPPTVTQRMASPASFVPPRRINAAVSANTEAVVLKALEMAKDRRYQSAGEMAQALQGERVVVGVARAEPASRQAATPEAIPTGRQKPGGILWGMSGVGLVAGGGLCLVLAAVAVLLGSGVLGGGSEPTPTRRPTATSRSPTRTPFRPTETPFVTDTPFPPTPLPTSTEVAYVTSVLFEDDFSDPATGWEVDARSSGSVGYGDGVYVVRGEATSKAVSGVAHRSFDDAIVEVEATQVLAAASNKNAYGIKCRVQPDGDGYGLLIRGDGLYSIWIIADGNWDRLVAWEVSAAINQGNATNRLRAVCDGSRLALIVNGELLAELEDVTYTGGDIALMAVTFEDEPTEIHFDNLIIRDPETILFEDDFSDPASGWTAGEWEGGSAGYRGGTYVMRAEDRSYYYYGQAGLSFTDVEIEVYATQVLGPAENLNSYGVGCRIQPNGDGYFLRIRGNGTYSIFREMEAGDEWLTGWVSSSVIRQGNATNHMRVICSGDYLALFVNGVLLAEARDDTFTDGDIALTVSTYEEGPTEVHFDNVLVYAP